MFVYVLQSMIDGSEYVGLTAEPNIRLKEHNAGRVRSTQYKKPWNRVLLEEYPDRLAARKREKYLK